MADKFRTVLSTLRLAINIHQVCIPVTALRGACGCVLTMSILSQLYCRRFFSIHRRKHASWLCFQTSFGQSLQYFSHVCFICGDVDGCRSLFVHTLNYFNMYICISSTQQWASLHNNQKEDNRTTHIIYIYRI